MGKDWSSGLQFVKRDTCLVCDNLFYVAPCIKKRGGMSGMFCSYKCKGIYSSRLNELRFNDLREEKNRLKNSKYIKVVTINQCKTCGADTSRIFCNRNCYSFYRLKLTGMNKIEKKCPTCNKIIYVRGGNNNNGYGIYCSISCAAQEITKSKTNPYQNSKGGKRTDLNDVYFRSRWEANYARYLNFLIKNKQILKWEFEPDTFIFHEVQRGTRSYLPDFKVWDLNNNIVYYEIKGYYDDKSKVKMKRMAKYYPNIKVELIDKTRYMVLHKQLKNIIPFWETDDSVKKAYLFR